MLRIILFIIGSISIGFILWNLMYFKENHCIVKVQAGLLSASDLLRILGIVGFILSFFK